MCLQPWHAFRLSPHRFLPLFHGAPTVIPPSLTPPSAALESASPLGSGHIHETFLANYSDGTRLVHQRLNTTVFPEPEKVMENLVAVTTHVRSALHGSSDAHRRVLQPVPASCGNFLHQDEAKSIWRTFRYIPDTLSYDVAPNTGVAYQVAHTFGEFQGFLGTLDPTTLHETLPGFHHTPSRLAAFQEALASDPKSRSGFIAAHLPAIKGLETVATVLTDIGLPLRAIHYDTKINNVLLDATTGEGLCVVDLDTLMPGIVPFDFGDLVRSAANPAPEDETDLKKVCVDPDLFAALAKGYIRGCGDLLTPEERAALPVSGAVIAYELALRFLTDYLRGDVYFAINHPKQNLDRGLAQLHLAKSFQDNLASLETTVARA